MIQVLHLSAECYPAAKTGGLGDVVGALPKYLCSSGYLSGAVIPAYHTRWNLQASWVTVFRGSYWMNWQEFPFRVLQQEGNSLGFPFFVIDIPGLFDRPGIYNDPSGRPFGDELQRSIGFQQAVVEWLLSFPWHERPRVLHCHDHHTGLVPWMIKYCPKYQELSPIPTVFTIHNGQYQGAFRAEQAHLLPPYESGARGLLEWKQAINPMAAAIKTAWMVTTVSPAYLVELHEDSLGLEALFRQEWRKQQGILNGIDAQVWDPRTDPMIAHHLQADVGAFKGLNKKLLCDWFKFDIQSPILTFIGRMVREKGADLLPDTIRKFLYAGGQCNFVILGNGEVSTQTAFLRLADEFPSRVRLVIDYNEGLAHQLYAGSDFLIMPSRVEPCGLNQLYAMRYGTIPVVRSVGGLKNTVPDIAEPDGSGRGFRFDNFSVADAYEAIRRATAMYHNEPNMVHWVREKIMSLDFSWNHTIGQYLGLYEQLGLEIRHSAETNEIKIKKRKGKAGGA
jgi:starch synthase